MLDAAPITAVLGPTNTGKTHRAIEQMLTHQTGMIGLPLRLLAREVYDRITTRIGETRVALVTGEEKRVPPRPDYWVCTVEAMPMRREVDFVAIDEIQLAAHEQRGHVFTERLLAARGRRETWFLGAETMRPLFRELVPTATIASYPRLSRLRFAGMSKLSRLPPRSAVVAFSTTQLYELAERLRAVRGGAAVVLGALSPRTRNAQVAMFQAGEVDYLVATDAIGMGLNLDVGHVAFAALRKFDGKDARGLEPAELAQIAGRAGRHLADGTFGTTAPLALPQGVASSIEDHRFPALRRLLWRSSDLDLGSVEALIASLRAPPRSRVLKRADQAEDAAALAALAADPLVRSRARGAEAVGILWDVCRVPDYRRLLFESHLALLREVFLQLVGPRAVLDREWIASRVAEIDDADGDVDALTGRIAAIRTFTYVSHQERWLEDAAEWQERSRAIEDRLSDALHDRLVQRFVDRKSSKRTTATKPRNDRRTETAEARREMPGHPFAALSVLREGLAEHKPAASRSPDAWVEGMVAATSSALAIDARARVSFEGKVVGQLTRGTTLLLPEARVAGALELGAGARSRVLRRLIAFARDFVDELLSPLRSPETRDLSPAGRGIVYELEQGLGTALRGGEMARALDLTPPDQELLAALGVRFGERVVYVASLLKPASVDRRLTLCAAFYGDAAVPPRPRPGAVSLPIKSSSHAKAYAAIGYPVFGPRALRADVAERVHSALTAPEATETPRADRLASWMGCSSRDAVRIAEELTLGGPKAHECR